jgi:hypothetical protein
MSRGRRRDSTNDAAQRVYRHGSTINTEPANSRVESRKVNE